MFVSIIIPMRNEENFIGRCLDSLLPQIQGRDNFEILCVDGMSSDKTTEIVRQYAKHDNRVRLIENPHKIMPSGTNLGIKQSRGDFIMVAGCHAEYAPDYLDKCLEVLQHTGAGQAGGYLETVPAKDTAVGRAITAATLSRFGAGPGVRIPGPEQEGFQASFGIFRRDVFKRFGLYDERLVRNQDLEFDCRIHKGGVKTIISPELHAKYRNRSTFAGLCRQMFGNGLWIPYTFWIVKGGVTLKHLVPLGFVMSILVFGLMGFVWHPLWLILIFELLVYLSVAFTLAISLAHKNRTSGFLVFLAFIQLHLAYGIGSLWGVLTAPFKFGFDVKHKHGHTVEYLRE